MDWKDVIAELQGFGLTQPQIANSCGCRQTTISALARGQTADPRHSLGEALRRLLLTKRAESAEKDSAPQDPEPGATRPGAAGPHDRAPDYTEEAAA